MDSLLTSVLCFGIILGYNAQQSGRIHYACREREEYYACRSPCEPTCDSISSGSRANCSGPCVAGCFCRNGLVRANDNSCAPPEDCFRPDCQENEELNECGSPCELNCTNLNDAIFCTKPCYRGCFCKPGFVRDAKRRCVPPANCYVAGTQQCGVNERYVQCVSLCNTCWEFNYCYPSFCRQGCDCNPGFHRNFYGECVSSNECYATYGITRPCGDNEEYSRCINNCNDCYYKGRCPYPQYYCEAGCDCRRGFFRNDRGVCVHKENCFRQCGANEVYVECGPSCRSTCENSRRHVSDLCRRDCVPGCVCRGNLVVGPDGTCIKPEHCPTAEPNCPVNESYYVCKPTCRNTCENFNDTNLLCDMSCTPGCFCKGDLVRRNDGTCVPKSECPVSSCPSGEVFYQCLPTCRTTCRSLSVPEQVCTADCRPGCFCQPGFVRSDNGTCVNFEDCKKPFPVQCPPGQEYYECLPTCGDTCENYNKSNVCTKVCVSGCACPRGTVKRRDGMCVRPRDCEIVCGPNEEFKECGTACPLTCNNWNRRRVCSQRCIKGCFCRRGFIFGSDGTCIRPRYCPKSKPSSTTDATSIDSRRGGTDDDESTDSTSITPTPEQTEIPVNITEKLETKTGETASTMSNSTEATFSEATTAVSTASLKSDTQSNTALSVETTQSNTALSVETTQGNTALSVETTQSNTALSVETTQSNTALSVETTQSNTTLSVVTVTPSEGITERNVTGLTTSSTMTKATENNPPMTTGKEEEATPSQTVTKSEEPTTSIDPMTKDESTPSSTQSAPKNALLTTLLTTIVTTITGTENGTATDSTR